MALTPAFNEPDEPEPAESVASEGPADTETSPTAAGAEPVSNPEVDDAALIQEFERALEIPSHLEPWFRRFQEDREYLNELCMLIDEDDTVATNYILRNQYVLLSQINARDPDIAITPKDLLELPPPPPPMPMLPPIGGMPLPGLAPAMPPLPMPGMPPMPMIPPPPTEKETLSKFGATCERVVKHFMDQAKMRRVLDGLFQDTLTCGIGWLKVVYQEDYQRDALGYKRHDDQLDKFAQLRYLREQYDAGNIPAGSSEYKELVDVNDTCKAYITGQIAADLAQTPPITAPQTSLFDGQPVTDAMGNPVMPPPDPRVTRLEALNAQQWLPLQEVPEVDRYRGFTLEQVMPDDMRWDWSIVRPEDVHHGDHIAQRLFMSREQIGKKFGVTGDELNACTAIEGGKARASAKSGRGAEDPADRSDPDAKALGDRCAIWELQSKKTGRVYVWASGMKRFLRNYVPSVTPDCFYTINPFYFNRVTGRFIPLSDTRMQMPLQDEINLMRTHEREARRACYPKIIVGQGLFAKGEKAKLENAHPYAVIEIKKANEVAKSLHEIQPPTIRPELYDTSRATREMEIMAGIPQQAAGTMGGSDSATEAAIANEKMGEQTDRRRATIEAFIHDIVMMILQMGVEVIDPDTALKIAGDGGVWPLIDRKKLFYNLQLNVRAGSTGKPDASKKLDTIQKIVEIATATGQAGTINLRGLLEEIVAHAGVYINLDKILPPMLPGMAPGLPGMPGMGGPGMPAGASGPMGAPPMTGPRPPEQIPGSPAAVMSKAA